MERFEVIDAIFNPKRTDDLKPGMDKWIGRRCLWEAQWLIEEEDGGDYIGQWAMMPIIKPGRKHPDFKYVWVPLCDLDIYNINEDKS